jgi:hypothetical protein
MILLCFAQFYDSKTRVTAILEVYICLGCLGMKLHLCGDLFIFVSNIFVIF